jgi:hypothetical protein
MKKCPQCNNLYPDETQYCLNDGQLLISEVLPLPSELSADDEEATVIRHEPIVVDLSAMNEPKTEVLPYQIQPPVQVKTKSNFGKYLAFMIIGLLLGGGLVLATMFFSRSLYQNNDAGSAKANSNVNASQSRSNIEPKNVATPESTPPPLNPEHQKRTDVSDDEFNGRVITLNAYVRSSPSRNSPQLDILPIDDRLTITARDNPNSPWFHVVCEHGSSGWMHGNTIEYTR